MLVMFEVFRFEGLTAEDIAVQMMLDRFIIYGDLTHHEAVGRIRRDRYEKHAQGVRWFITDVGRAEVGTAQVRLASNPWAPAGRPRAVPSVNGTEWKVLAEETIARLREVEQERDAYAEKVGSLEAELDRERQAGHVTRDEIRELLRGGS